jgi:hypothetical protein
MTASRRDGGRGRTIEGVKPTKIYYNICNNNASQVQLLYANKIFFFKKGVAYQSHINSTIADYCGEN